MTDLVLYKPWENDSQHNVYDTANARRIELFEEKIEGLQVKVKRTSEGKFVVKTRVPVPPKPVAKKKAKAPAKKTTAKSTKTTKAATKKTAATKSKAAASPKAETPTTPSNAATTKKRTTRKTSRKRK